MTEPMEQVARLAMRVEGASWVAYYAMPNTMKHAIVLGSIKMALVQKPERKEAFLALMRDCMADVMEHAMGARPEFPNPPEPAPESERSGSA